MHLRRPVVLALALLTALTLLVTGGAQSVTAAPSGSGVDDEGGTPALRKKLDEAARGYAAAKAKLDNSKKRQAQFAAQQKTAEKQLADLNVHVQQLAATAYRNGRLSAFTTLLNSASPDEFLQRAETMDMLAMRDDALLREYAAAKADANRQKLLVDNEIKVQLKQLSDMEKRKKQAQQALVAAGGGGTTSGTLVSYNSPAAAPAPRNSDGSWPSESCSVNDPTSDGCITPRLLHAYQEARKDGFTRYTHCYRSGGSGEHPKGRACDFSAAAGGFENVNATGGDKDYGNRLAAYFIKNANALAVMYVIWYGRIWMPSTGWSSYSGCCDPAATHKNHVHLSVL
jgi:peptidoglycan DL-endopeptidase CwlO